MATIFFFFYLLSIRVVYEITDDLGIAQGFLTSGYTLLLRDYPELPDSIYISCAFTVLLAIMNTAQPPRNQPYDEIQLDPLEMPALEDDDEEHSQLLQAVVIVSIGNTVPTTIPVPAIGPSNHRAGHGATLSVFAISISLYNLCPSSSSLWYAAIGGTTLYVVLLFISHFCTNVRIYKDDEPPLPATRASYSVILVAAMFYFPYYYSTIHVLIYVCSMFAFGISMFQLNSPMDTKHAVYTLFFGFFSAFEANGIGNWPDSQRSFWWVIVFTIMFAKLLFPMNGIYI
ncbi:unnamed protein product [Arabidopsis arenosa]|uniref:Uncharacterized protein n=1 Tax=Arabidopsis arenosa TaxID=38785 RepID=A0A8S1ZJY9_ARAAE|nr:unnamed protein product [Arabidopsis arenosa]